MSSAITTPWDIKTALTQIIQAIDEGGNLFRNLDDEEKHTIENFTKALAKRRDECKKALDEHYDALEREIYPMLDRLDKLRSKLTEIKTLDVIRQLPSTFDLKELNQIADALERFERLNPSTLSLLQQTLALVGARHSNTPTTKTNKSRNK